MFGQCIQHKIEDIEAKWRRCRHTKNTCRNYTIIQMYNWNCRHHNKFVKCVKPNLHSTFDLLWTYCWFVVNLLYSRGRFLCRSRKQYFAHFYNTMTDDVFAILAAWTCIHSVVVLTEIICCYKHISSIPWVVKLSRLEHAYSRPLFSVDDFAQ